MERSWRRDNAFMGIAHTFAKELGTCTRLKVGAVLVQDKQVRGIGYNGAPSNVKSCEDLGECLIDENHGGCVRTVHAEINVILQTDREHRKGATMYVTDRPCWNCACVIANSGISEVIFDRPYRKDAERVESLFKEKGILLKQHIYESRDKHNGN